MLLSFLPREAAQQCTVGSGHNALSETDRELYGDLYPEGGAGYVDALVPVRPRDVDYRGLLESIACQDFPSAGRVALHANLVVVNRDRPVVFDMPDDRYCGVAADTPDRLREVFESGIAPLNDYRREDMERVFGYWPEVAAGDC